MQIRPLRSTIGDYGSLKRNRIAEIPDHIARQLIKRGVAVPVQAGASEKKEAAGKAAARPSSTHQTGSRTGAGKRSSSSPADRASTTSRSSTSRDEPA